MSNKITLKEFFETNRNLYIHCDTEEKAYKLLKAFDRMGKTWWYGDSYLENKNDLYIYKKNTCYCNSGYSCHLEFCVENDYKIYKFEDVIFEEGAYNLNFEKSIYVKNVKIISENNRLTEKTDKGYRIKFDGIHSEAEITQMIIERFGILEDALLEMYKNERTKI